MVPKNIFILRPDNLGDLVLFSGTLKHYRSLFPNATITLFIKSNLKNLLDHCPYVDNLEDWEKLSSVPLEWLPEFPGKYHINWLIRRLFNFRIGADLILLPVRAPKGGLFGMQKVLSTIHSDEKVGIAGDYSNQSKKDDNMADKFYTKRLQLTNEKSNAHELDIHRDFLKFIGRKFGNNDIWPELWTTDKDCKWAQTYIPPKNSNIKLAVCPGVTSRPGKFYSGINYAKAITVLENSNFEIVLFGDEECKEMCKEVEKSILECKNVARVINLCGKSTIRQMIEGLKKCDVVLSQETGSLHIAVALGKPTVGIIGGGHFGRFYPWGDKRINRVANKFMNCYGCNWHCRYEIIRCIKEIKPEQVSKQLRLALIEADLSSNK